MQLAEVLVPGRAYPPGELRDVVGVSRKYLIPLLEYLDQQGVTRRSAEGGCSRPRRPPEARALGHNLFVVTLSFLDTLPSGDQCSQDTSPRLVAHHPPPAGAIFRNRSSSVWRKNNQAPLGSAGSRARPRRTRSRSRGRTDQDAHILARFRRGIRARTELPESVQPEYDHSFHARRSARVHGRSAAQGLPARLQRAGPVGGDSGASHRRWSGIPARRESDLALRLIHRAVERDLSQPCAGTGLWGVPLPTRSRWARARQEDDRDGRSIMMQKFTAIGGSSGCRQ